MPSWGKCDFSEFKELRDRLTQLEQSGINEYCLKMSKQIAQRLLRRVKQRTPVGDYEVKTYTKKDGTVFTYNEGMQGGTLRNNWSIKSNVTKEGTVYEIEIINPTEYASYVEYGHRQEPGRFVPQIGKRLKNGWALGKFMLKISEEEVQAMAPGLLEKELNKMLRGLFDV